MTEHTLIRIKKDDLDKMRKDGLKLYLAHHPDRWGCKISDAELFASLIKFYLS